MERVPVRQHPGNGLCRLRAGHWDRFTTTNGLPSDRVWAFFEDADGRLWIGTERGLASHREGRFTGYTRGQGYFADIAHQILEDDAGNLWVAADRGIGRIRKQALFDFAAGQTDRVQWVVYDDAEGLLSAETSPQRSIPLPTFPCPRLWQRNVGKGMDAIGVGLLARGASDQTRLP